MNLSDIIAEENADKKIEIEEAVNRLGHDRAVLYLWLAAQAEMRTFSVQREHINRILAKYHKSSALQ